MRPRKRQRPKSLQRRLCIETLEDRRLLAVDLELLKDVWVGTQGSSPSAIVAAGDKTFFAAEGAGVPIQLWVTDGTPTGTHSVLDGNLFLNSHPEIVALNGKVFFTGNNDGGPRELWTSDGTDAGTDQVSALANPGWLTVFNDDVYFNASNGSQIWKYDVETSSAVQLSSGLSQIGNLIVSGDYLFFTAADSAGLELWRTDGTAPGTIRVSDIAPGASHSFATYLTAFNDKLYFRAHDGNTHELYVSDGTPGGTGLFYNVISSPEYLETAGDSLFFWDNYNNELWKTDGTGPGTVLVKDFSNINTGHIGLGDSDKLYFTQSTPATGLELWVSDGTDAGTNMVADIRPGTAGSSPANGRKVGGMYYFAADDGVHGRELWRTDGTAAGTELVVDLYSGTDTKPDPIVYEGAFGRLFITAQGDEVGHEVWTVNGPQILSPPQLVKDIGLYPNARETSPGWGSGFVQFGDYFYFGADDGENGIELWKSDGTLPGTQLVKDIRLSKNIDGITNTHGSKPDGFTVVGNTLYFTARDDEHGWELWRTDGTTAGTTLVKDIFGSSGSIESMHRWKGLLYFVADVSGSQNLWKTDGTEAGTSIVRSDVSVVAIVGTTMYFNADDTFWRWDESDAAAVQVLSTTFGSNGTTVVGDDLFTFRLVSGTTQLWKTDGTAAGTTYVADAEADGYTLSDPIALNGQLLFAGGDGELWISDGTTAGTQQLKEIRPGSDRAQISYFAVIENIAYFAANNGVSGRELWRTDGTESGTFQVIDLYPGTDGAFGIVEFGADFHSTGEDLYFWANDGVHGRELWTSDGTAAGTELVADINAGAKSSFPRNITVLPGGVFFGASDGVRGYSLWKVNPATNGASLVRDIHANITGSADLWEVTEMNGEFYFYAETGEFFDQWQTYGNTTGSDMGLWKTDGTEEGTVLVKGDFDGAIGGFVSTGDQLFFVKFGEDENGNFTRELWRSDGTTEGTIRLRSFAINEDYGTIPIRRMTAFNGELFFVSYEPATGWELWKSDGTVQGTVLFSDFIPGPAINIWTGIWQADIHERGMDLLVIGSTLYFTAVDASASNSPDWGDETLWRTDGTIQGTAIVRELSEGGPRQPHSLKNVNGTLYYIDWEFRSSEIPQLWTSDGTALGTVVAPEELYHPDFVTTAGVQYQWTGDEFWKSDGTVAGTEKIMDFNRTVRDYAEIDGTIYFLASTQESAPPDRDHELWKSDGTATGTVQLFDFGNHLDFGEDLFVHNGLVYVNLELGLWVTDGTTAGTLPLDIDGGELTRYGDKLLLEAKLPQYDSELALLGVSAPITVASFETNSPVVETGRLIAADTNGTGEVTVAVLSVSTGGNVNGISTSNFLDMLSLESGPIVVAPSRVGDLTWTFDSGGETFDFLAEVETLTLNYVLRYEDADGGVTLQHFVINIIGTSEPPPELPGDYNLDSNVDAADYVVWRKFQGTTGWNAYELGDGNGDTNIDDDDLAVWVTNFGESMPMGPAGGILPQGVEPNVESRESREGGVAYAAAIGAASGGYDLGIWPHGMGEVDPAGQAHSRARLLSCSFRTETPKVGDQQRDDGLLAWLAGAQIRVDDSAENELVVSAESPDDAHGSSEESIDEFFAELAGV